MYRIFGGIRARFPTQSRLLSYEMKVRRDSKLREIYAPFALLKSGSDEYVRLAKSGKVWEDYFRPQNTKPYDRLQLVSITEYTALSYRGMAKYAPCCMPIHYDTQLALLHLLGTNVLGDKYLVLVYSFTWGHIWPMLSKYTVLWLVLDENTKLMAFFLTEIQGYP